jgi:predicted double-glycine peptidase
MYLRGDQAKIRKEGFSLLDMQRYLAGAGYRADGFELPLQKLLDARMPAIVLVAEKGYQHFVVIKGGTAERILIGDPAGGTRAMPRERFDSIWRNKLLFVIHSHAGLAAFNRPEDWNAAPHYPLAEAVGRDSAAVLSLSKLGPGDF